MIRLNNFFHDKTKVILGLLLIISVSLLVLTAYKWYQAEKTLKRTLPDIEFTDDSGVYNKIFKSNEDIDDLRKVNKNLYDSIKAFKNEIGFILQFTAKNQYSTGKVDVNETQEDTLSTTFEYTSNQNDTLYYKLRINARKEPNWYSIDIATNTTYTIINKEYEDDLNHITVDGNGGNITDVTVFNKKDKKKTLLDRFVIGPSVGVGYDPVRKQIAPTIGVSLTFDLKNK